MLEPTQSLFLRQQAFALLLVTYSFMFTLMVIDIANVSYSPTINRITTIQIPFDITFTTAKNVDYLLVFVLAVSFGSLLLPGRLFIALPIAAAAATAVVASYGSESHSLVSFFVSPVIVAVAFYAARRYSILGLQPNRQLLYATALKFAVGMEAFGIIRWILFPAFPSPVLGDLSWKFSEIETKAFYMIGFASPAFLVAIASGYLIRYVVVQLDGTRKRMVAVVASLASTDIKDIKVSPRKLLIAALAASIILPVYPYIPSINPDFKTVSTDVFYYTLWMETVLASESPGEFLENTFVNISGGDRPLSLLVFSAIKAATGLPLATVLQLMPVVLTPALTLSAYYFTRTGSKNIQLASVVALAAPFSTTVVVGIYTGFYANWIAIIFSLLAFSYVLKFLESGRKRYLPVALGFVLAVLFAHNYTWSYLVSALVLFTAAYGVIHRHQGRMAVTLALVGAVIACSIAADVAKMILLSNDSGIDKELTAATNQLAADEFAKRWNNLNYVFTIFFGGYYTNSVLYALALAWVIGARYRDNNMNLAIMSMLFIGSIALFTGEYSVQGRVIWNMPIFVAGGIVMYNLIRSPASMTNKLVFIAIMLHFGNYALRSLANLQLPP